MIVLNYKTIRSRRKTAAIQIKDGKIIARVPFCMKDGEVESFILSHNTWIEKHLKMQEEQKCADESIPPLSSNEIKELKAKAKAVIPQRVEYFASLIGVNYKKITVRSQRTRWGSCSAKGNLSFNCLLMLAPPEVLDSVIVHELCHRKEMNHSNKFYSEVLKFCPDYYQRNAWLKKNGTTLLMRLKRN